MTREFKFRAWDKHGGFSPKGEPPRMLYGVGVTNAASRLFDDEPMWFMNQGLLHVNPKSDDFVLMQWTGWKDDNQPRKEIYEGDFLQDKREQNWLVIWSDTEAAWMLVRRSYWHRFSDVIMSGPWRISGNQFENPELL